MAVPRGRPFRYLGLTVAQRILRLMRNSLTRNAYNELSSSSPLGGFWRGSWLLGDPMNAPQWSAPKVRLGSSRLDPRVGCGLSPRSPNTNTGCVDHTEEARCRTSELDPERVIRHRGGASRVHDNRFGWVRRCRPCVLARPQEQVAGSFARGQCSRERAARATEHRRMGSPVRHRVW